MTFLTEAASQAGAHIVDRSVVLELVFEEIERMVADAIKDQSCLYTAACAEKILRAYPGCGLSERELGDQIMMFAASAGVAVEFGRHASQAASAARGGSRMASTPQPVRIA